MKKITIILVAFLITASSVSAQALPKGNIFIGDNGGTATSSDQVYVEPDTGNVGIGTVNPQSFLQIGSNVDASSQALDVRANSGGYVASFEQDYFTGWGVLIDTDGALVSQPAFNVKNATSSLFYVGSNGYVGIGTTNPKRPLHVVGDIFTTAGIGFNYLGEGGLRNVIYRGGTDFTILRNFSRDYTILKIWAPKGALTEEREATLALTREEDGNAEYFDIYNNGYNSEKQHGIRIQKRGDGEYRDFVFDQYDGTTKTSIMVLGVDRNVSIGEGIQLNTNSNSKPTCDSDVRGTFWVTKGGIDVADIAEICLKDASNNYGWVAI